MNALCRGGTVANGNCRHCRQVAADELLVRQEKIPGLLNCLGRLRDPAQIAMACDKMVGAEVEVRYASDRRTVEFLRSQWSRVKTLGRTTLRSSPAVAATILAFPSLASSVPCDLAEGIDLLAWVTSIANWRDRPKPNLSGQQSFENLNAEDIFLAACYWTPPELDNLSDRDRWSWTNVQQCLGGRNSELARKFKVLALQPRMAEIAFPAIYQKIEPGGAAELRDLNKAVLETQHSWTLADRPPLPPEDWEVNGSMLVDVKCNLFFRTFDDKVGLRGFAIDLKEERPEGCIAGVVFFDSDPWGSRWSFIGFLRPGDVPGAHNKERIAPFWFRMPDNCRIDVIPRDDRDAAIVAQLVASIDKSAEHTRDALGPRWPSLLPWADKIRLSEVDLPPDARDAIGFVAEALGKMRQKHFEITLWQAVTDAVIRIRSEGRPKNDVDQVLKVFERIYRSAWLPVHLARVGRGDLYQEQTLLELWNNKVLRPLNESWDNISCPSCGAKQVTVKPNTLTALGTLYGSLQCSCGSAIDVTLITHCRGCGHHPLVIGQNELCRDCNGLKCDWPVESGHVCGRCKCGF